MAEKLYIYAFYTGENSYGIVDTWATCQAIIKNVNNAVYKKFTDRKDATQFLSKTIKEKKGVK